MNSLTVAVIAVALAVTSAGIITHSVEVPLAKSTLLQGPSTSTHVIGPDGSQIVANAPGGVVNTVESIAPIPLESIAPIAYAAAPIAYSAPIAYGAAPIAYGAPITYGAAPAISTTVIKSAPVLAGPIAPLAYGVPIGAPLLAKTILASPLTAAGYPVLAAGSGIEGQYIHDYAEKLYDDGSYKGEIY